MIARDCRCEVNRGVRRGQTRERVTHPLANGLAYAALALLWSGSWSIASTGQFLTAPTYHTRGVPDGVAVGDFNGDGELDVATANGFSPQGGMVAVLLGDGKGGFNKPVTYVVNGSPNAIVAADLNRDGRLDLVVSPGDVGAYGPTVLLGNGDGTFRPPVSYAVDGAPSYLAVGDFNRDGRLDIATSDGSSTNQGNDTVSVLLGNGDGTFRPPVYTSMLSPAGLVAGDFNRDGQLDLAVAVGFEGGGSAFALLLGNGDGSFQAPVEYGKGLVAFAVAAADLNRDGKLDLVVDDEDTDYGLSVFLGNGDGTFQPAISYPGEFGTPALADLNHDGKLDLVLAGYTVEVLAGNGDGTFGLPGIYEVGAGSSATSVAIADFNRDGNADVVVGDDQIYNLSLLAGTGRGGLLAARVYRVTQASSGCAGNPIVEVLGDFNNDGKLDLAGLNYCAGLPGNDLDIVLGNGNGSFQAPVSYQKVPNAQSLASADLNGDGKLDLVTANGGSNTASVLLGNGDGTFKSPVSYATGSFPRFVAIGDFNLDGRLDLATADEGADTVSVLLGNGDGTFQPAVIYRANPGPACVAVGDFNGDGKPDLAVANETTQVVSVLLGNGDGTFQPPASYGVLANPDFIVAADLTGAGKLDLVVSYNRSKLISVLLGRGDGSFSAPANYVAGVGVGQVFAADFNADGKLDLAASSSNADAPGVRLLYGNGDGTFAPAAVYAVVEASGALAVGDLNRDGKPDLAVANSDGFAVLLGQ